MSDNNNSGAVIAILLIAGVFSSMFSSAGFAYTCTNGSFDFDKFDTDRCFKLPVKPKPTKKPPSALDAIVSINDDLNKGLAQLDVDPEEMRKMIEDAYEKTCIITPSNNTCPATMSVVDGCCAFDDPEQQSKFAKGVAITNTIVKELLIVYFFEKAVVAMYRVGVALNTRLGGQAVGAGSSAIRSARVAGAAGRSASRTATRGGIKMALRACGRASMKLVGGPIGILLIAFEVVSLVLDILDPMGYQTFQPNEIFRNLRNKLDVNMEKALSEGEMSNNQDYPMTFPLSYAFPEYEDEYTSKLFEKFVVKALDLLDSEMVIEFFISVLESESDDAEMSDTLQAAVDEAFALALATNNLERDQFTYDFFASKGLADQIELVPFMSTARRMGVTLSQHGANLYNTRMREKHMLYSNPYDVVEDTEIPDDYLPFVACYTDKYRILDTSNPGTGENPNVIEKTLEQKCVLANPYGIVFVSCIIGTKTQAGTRVNPEDYGVTFNQETGYCDYTAAYCSRMGLRTEPNDCGLYPGQKWAEMIFGTSIVRTGITTANAADDAFIGIGNTVSYIVTHPEEVADSVEEVFTQLPEGAAGGFVAIGDTVGDVVSDPESTGNSIVSGIESGFNAIGSFFSSF